VGDTFPKPHVMLLGRCKMPDAKVKLLIVDDDVSIRTSLSSIVTGFGHSVRSSADVMTTSPECLRTFPQVLGKAICLIHETGCVHCRSLIHFVERGRQERRKKGVTDAM
jgi:hypothetical protein